jgi:DNA uptake protein ComE-like DNA-binding protein
VFFRLLWSSIPKSQWLAVGVAAAAVLIAVAWRWIERHQAAPSALPVSVVVEVCGDVRYPGIFILDAPAAVSKAVATAGGCSAEAATTTTPSPPPPALQQNLRTGQRLRVACANQEIRQIDIEPMRAAARLTLGLRLDLNEADTADLALVPGMKPLWAETIVARRSHRRWQQLDELQQIPGIGSRTVAKWASFLEVSEEGRRP